jgi:hypothetical protein
MLRIAFDAGQGKHTPGKRTTDGERIYVQRQGAPWRNATNESGYQLKVTMEEILIMKEKVRNLLGKLNNKRGGLCLLFTVGDMESLSLDASDLHNE